MANACCDGEEEFIAVNTNKKKKKLRKNWAVDEGTIGDSGHLKNGGGGDGMHGWHVCRSGLG